MKATAIAEVFLLAAVCLLAWVVWKQQEELTLLGAGLGRLEAGGAMPAVPPVPAAVDGSGEAAT